MKTLMFSVRAFALAVLVALCPARATVPSSTTYLQYTLSTNPQALPVTFVFNNAADLLVLDTRSPAAPVVLTLNSDYSVSGGSGSTGTINTIAGGSHGVLVADVITVSRSVPITQTTSFTNTGPLTASMIGQAFDKQTQISQQINLNGLRSLQFPGDEVLSGVMPLAARKNNVVGFDSNGALTFYSFVGGSIAPQSVSGTANEVLVNGTSGTPTTGAITLTTPQAIGTGSLVQFQRLGIGGSVSANSDVAIVHSTPAVTAQASVVVSGTITAPAATDLHPDAYRDQSGFVSSVDADGYASYDALAGVSGTHAYNHLIGFQARSGFNGSGTLGRLEGFSGFMSVNSGTVTEARVFYVPNLTVGGGTVVHYSGLYIDQLSAGTTRHAIYAAGNDPWFSAGGQIFTSALLTTPAGATTCVIGGTFNQTSQTGLAIMNSNATATGTFASFCNNGGTVQGTITQTNSTTTAYNTSSDARLKENVRPFVGSGAILDAMQPRVFDWRWGGKDAHGFVAQELAAVYPEAVTKGDEGAEIHTAWSVDYSKLTPLLTAEVKDLRRRVRNLEIGVGALALFCVAQAAILSFRFNPKRP